jgi:hypothetical protein
MNIRGKWRRKRNPLKVTIQLKPKMWSSIPQNVWVLWPHLLTPTVFFLFFTLPAFPRRGTLLTVFTALMVYPCLLAPSPPIPHIATPRFGLVAMWLFYVGWLGKMLFHDPEHDFWRTGRPPHEAEAMPFGWQKFKWAASLLCSWRGVGWNCQVRRLPAPRPRVGRWRFAAREVARAAVYYVLHDAASAWVRRCHFYDEADSIANLSWPRRAALETASAASAAWMHQYQFAVYGAVFVAMGIYEEEVSWVPHNLTKSIDQHVVRTFFPCLETSRKCTA